MLCPYCKGTKTGCLESRQDGEVRRRRYQCKKCGFRFGTSEVVTSYDYTKVSRENWPQWYIAHK